MKFNMDLSEKKLVERIKGYVKHAGREDNKVPLYPLDEVGVFRIYGGTTGDGSASGLCYGGRYGMNPDIVKGRFVDAISFALRFSNFYGWWCSGEDMDNDDHGYIVKVEPHELEEMVSIG